MLPSLLEGYGEVFPLPPEYEQRINMLSMLIGVRALALNIRRMPPDAYQRHLTAALRRATTLLSS